MTFVIPFSGQAPNVAGYEAEAGMEMETGVRIVTIAGSLHREAYVHRLLRAVTRELPEGAVAEDWDGLGGVTPLSEGPPPREIDRLCHALSGADGALITAPAHSVMPVQLRQALGWVSSGRGGAVLVGKPVVVVTACPRPHEALWARTELGQALASAGASVHGIDLILSAGAGRLDAEGRLDDPDLRERLRPALKLLCAPSLARSST
ncbi:NAD(P)H-dependent oxidoreductase [Streptosporangium saharense]|uniref:NAD(P)H-dependent oxidoreductase n=1 Tax=Streptosporangium saharense TaxID=1706840 RepID=UPI003444ED14